MKDLKSNVILADYKVSDNWDYKKAIEKTTGEKWEVKTFVTNRLHGNSLKAILRYIEKGDYHDQEDKDQREPVRHDQHKYGLALRL